MEHQAQGDTSALHARHVGREEKSVRADLHKAKKAGARIRHIFFKLFQSWVKLKSSSNICE